MNEFITEPERRTSIDCSFDVVVAGGGIAGIAAAVAAARSGASVCLVEKGYALGGLATLGLVIAYLPLCDGLGNLVSTGLAEELLLLATKDGSAAIPPCWLPGGSPLERHRTRYFLEYNAASYILELESFVLANGVKLLYDTRMVSTYGDFSRIGGVVIEGKAGRKAIVCKAIVDATGDADACFLSGEKTISLSTNSAAGWYYSAGQGGNKLHKLFKPFDPAGEQIPPGVERGYAGDSPDEVTAHIVESRRMIREHIGKLRTQSSDLSAYPFMIPSYPGFRMTRRLVGEIEMDAQDRMEWPDSVGLIGNWRRPGPIYSIPFRALRGSKYRNLFTAGRCISAKGHGWDMARVIPACAVTGEASGTASAMFAATGMVDVQCLQERLVRNKVQIKLSQIGD